MSEGTSTSHDRPEAGNPYPWLRAASGGTYHFHGRAWFPESAKPPAQFLGGRLAWEPIRDDLWRFDGEAGGNVPGDSTLAVVHCAGYSGESEAALVNRRIMDALWAAGCRAARVDSYTWEADLSLVRPAGAGDLAPEGTSVDLEGRACLVEAAGEVAP